jgi:hypothetical protein
VVGLTFVIPVRHQATVKNWAEVKARLTETLRSISAQKHTGWNCVVVANEGADLPVVPEKVEVVRVDFPPAVLPNQETDREAFYEAVRSDKGRRILAGLIHAKPKGHVMVVDYDDFVSNRLAGTVADNPTAFGWYLEFGLLYDGGQLLLKRGKFYEKCGTSHIIRADLLQIPDSILSADESYIRRTLGSHRFVKDDLARSQTPLQELPYPGAIYRVGYSGNTSGKGNLLRMIVSKESLLHPRKLLQDLSDLKYLSGAIAREFFGA